MFIGSGSFKIRVAVSSDQEPKTEKICWSVIAIILRLKLYDHVGLPRTLVLMTLIRPYEPKKDENPLTANIIHVP